VRFSFTTFRADAVSTRACSKTVSSTATATTSPHAPPGSRPLASWPCSISSRHLISLVSSEDVGDIMIADPVIAVETETVDDAIRKMIAHDLGELPVVDERGRLLGSISIHTILEAWLQIESEGVEKDNPSTSESQLTQS
jgi:hypothetical protein